MLTLLENQQLAADPEKINHLLIWGGAAFLAVTAMLITISVIRKTFFPKEREVDAAPAGFGLSQLKNLHAQGLLTDEEFDTAKAKIVATSHAAFMAPKGKTAAKK